MDVKDNGPWGLYFSQEGKLVGVISEDFEHDVVLAVSGDFPDAEAKYDYCRWLVRKLNHDC